jgi:hypothetical protein
MTVHNLSFQRDGLIRHEQLGSLETSILASFANKDNKNSARDKSGDNEISQSGN